MPVSHTLAGRLCRFAIILTAGLLFSPVAIAQTASAKGKMVYVTHCAACHGDKGDGAGAMARFLYPKPRNFGEGKFRVVTTANAKPSDADLMQVINKGMPGSAMFPFGHLPETERKDLLVYLRELIRESFVQRARQEAEAMEETADLDELRKIADQILKPGEVIALPADLPAPGTESVKRGAALYKASCASCHGDTGKGDGTQEQKDDNGTPTRPRDLTRGIFKGGRDPLQLYARIMLGMPGSPMPASNATLKPNEAGDLMNFIQSLSAPHAGKNFEHTRLQLVAKRVNALPENGDASTWKSAQAVTIIASPLWWREYANPDVQVAVVHDGKTLAVRLTWHDATPNRSMARPEDFVDMAAVQFCNGKPEPFLGMGSTQTQVDLWHWRAGMPEKPTAEGLLDDYPFDLPIYRQFIKQGQKPPDFLTARAAGNPGLSGRDVASLGARGAGSTTFMPVPSQQMAAKAEWKDNRWTVVFQRPLVTTPDAMKFATGSSYSIAFALWDGSVRDRNGQKLVSVWHDLKVEE
jgi:mono/diheme cytochrome c family protein